MRRKQRMCYDLDTDRWIPYNPPTGPWAHREPWWRRWFRRRRNTR